MKRIRTPEEGQALMLAYTRKYQRQWDRFCGILADGYRPERFEDYWACVDGMCGFYKREAEAVWRILRVEEFEGRAVRTFAEVGRNMGGMLFCVACACYKLERVTTIDLHEYRQSDDALRKWFARHGIEAEIVKMDSAQYQPRMVYDFALIDGAHSAQNVRADIDIWKDKARLICFHDYADQGRANSHRSVHAGVVDAVSEARTAYGWQHVGPRGCSEIVFRTGVQ